MGFFLHAGSAAVDRNYSLAGPSGGGAGLKEDSGGEGGRDPGIGRGFLPFCFSNSDERRGKKAPKGRGGPIFQPSIAPISRAIVGPAWALFAAGPGNPEHFGALGQASGAGDGSAGPNGAQPFKGWHLGYAQPTP